MSENSEHIGYGKPRTRTQLKKGRSGNPLGRPKGGVSAPVLAQGHNGRSEAHANRSPIFAGTACLLFRCIALGHAFRSPSRTREVGRKPRREPHTPFDDEFGNHDFQQIKTGNAGDGS